MENLISSVSRVNCNIINKVVNTDYSISEFMEKDALAFRVRVGLNGLGNNASIKKLNTRRLFDCSAKEYLDFVYADNEFMLGLNNGRKMVYHQVDKDDVPYLTALISVMQNFDINEIGEENNYIMQNFVNLPNEFFGIDESYVDCKQATDVFASYFPKMLKSMYLAQQEGNTIGMLEKLGKRVKDFTIEFPLAFDFLKDRVADVRGLVPLRERQEIVESIENMQL